MTGCWVSDIEDDLPADLIGMRLDAIVFSHVLEHVRDPALVLQKSSTDVPPGEAGNGEGMTSSNHSMGQGRRIPPALGWAGGAWGLIGVSLALLHRPSEWQATVGVLILLQAFCGVLTWHRFRLTRDAVLPDFLTVMLFILFITKTVSALGLIVRANAETFGEVGQLLLKRESVPLEYQFQAELVFLLAAVVFTGVWRALEGRHLRALWHQPPSKILWAVYGLTGVGYLGFVFAGFGASLDATEDLLRLFAIGALAVLLGGRGPYAMGSRKSWLAMAALVPFLVLALRSGMKGEVGLVMLPILLPIFRRMTVVRFVFLGAFMLFVLLFLFPFSEAWRRANWAGWHGYENAGIHVVASRVFDRWADDGLVETAAQSLVSWATRGSSAEAGGLVMQLAERDGFIGPVLLEGLATIFVPRVLWPDKPRYTPGAWFTWYLGQASSPETATSATPMMLPTELYWMFGLGGVVFGMIFLAVLYFVVWERLRRLSRTGLVPMLALFALLARSAGMEESHTIYAVSAPVMLLVYVIVFDWLQKLLMPGLSVRLVPSARP
jgi:hypothetical protein